MNILLTSAGRRNYLVRYFQEALAGQGKVLAADASADAPALQEANQSFIIPPASDPNYLDSLISICKRHNVRLLFPLNDLELPILARNRDRFLELETIPVVSSPEVIDTCFDKWATNNFLQKLGLDSPTTLPTLKEAKDALDAGRLSFPLVIKPRWGSASIGIDCVENMEELGLAYQLTKSRLMKTFLWDISSKDPDRCLLIQQWLPGKEFGLDIVNDLDGRYVVTFVKQKLSMRAGETDKAITVESGVLQSIGKIISENLLHIGNLDCDVFVDGATCCVLEMNPRFGGGYPFSHMGGADLPAALIAWAKNELPDPKWLGIRPQIASAKCDRLVEMVNQRSFGKNP